MPLYAQGSGSAVGRWGLSRLSDGASVSGCRCSPVPGILQARILEWVAISFSNA